MDLTTKKELISYLSGFISEPRRQRMETVVSQRTNYLHIVLENMYQAHNASAVLRSCDCFGIQNVHFIENKNHLKISDDVAMGSSNWLNIHRHKQTEQNTAPALTELKRAGYRIVATTPHKNDFTIDTLPINQKMALVFGTEIDGITPEVLALADDFVNIPMFGFTESFNVSVCAALCMYELTKRMRAEVSDYYLTEAEQTEVYFNWLRTTINKGDLLVERYLESKQRV